jgi:peptidoglycan/LPS O-acetylase OafA/YrhL
VPLPVRTPPATALPDTIGLGALSVWIAFLVTATLVLAVLFGEAAFFFGWIAVPDPKRRVGCIDGLRGYLALAVFLHHSFHWLYGLRDSRFGPPTSNVLANLGSASVALFFMITAVLFYPKVLRRFSDREWLAHFISRIFRLTPLLWTATAAVSLVALIRNKFALASPPGVAILSLLQWLTFYGTPDLFGYRFTYRIIAGVTWSLVYEWGFYIALPALSYSFALLRDRVRPLAVLLGFSVYFEWLIYIGYDGPRYYIVFAIGMLVAEVVRNPKAAGLLRSRWAAVLGLAALLAEFLLGATAFSALPPILLAVFLAPVVAGNSYFKILSLKGSVILGEVSYGIYLLHGILLYVVVHLAGLSVGYYGIPPLALLVIAVAMFMHQFVEAPAIAFGKRVSNWVQRSEFCLPWITPPASFAVRASSAGDDNAS